jgi:hypothetical protein
MGQMGLCQRKRRREVLANLLRQMPQKGCRLAFEWARGWSVKDAGWKAIRCSAIILAQDDNRQRR